MLVIAITISAIAAWYSVAGLTAIFAAAVIPVILMGGALEAGKIVATVWLHNNWDRISWAYKTYLIPAIVFLMLLTSMGIFGFLSKGHADQSIVSGDASSKVAIYDEKISIEKDNIVQAKKAIEQMNSQVDQMLGRSDNETGAQRAVNIRKGQAKERASLQADITKAQKELARLQEERAPFAAEFRKVEAEVGPIKYIAALIYGDNPDQNVLERAVRWVIILIVIVFDPLALCLILAANKQLEWARQGTGGWVHAEDEEPPAEVITTTEPLPIAEVPPDPVSEAAPFFDNAAEVAKTIDAGTYQEPAPHGRCPSCSTALVDVGGKLKYCPNPQCNIIDSELPPIPPLVETPVVAEIPVEEEETAPKGNATDEEFPAASQPELEIAEEVVEPVVENKPKPRIDPSIPTMRGDYAVRYQGKVYNLDAFNSMHPNIAIQADNDTPSNESQCGFGTAFPDNPAKGDMFIRVDYMPERLFKWNNQKWIEVDKNTTDSYTYNKAYIQHLIQKLEAGEYEIEDLSDSEQAQVEEQIEKIVKSKNA